MRMCFTEDELFNMFCQTYRKTRVSEPIFDKVKFATLSKRDSDTGFFLLILLNYQGQLFL